MMTRLDVGCKGKGSLSTGGLGTGKPVYGWLDWRLYVPTQPPERGKDEVKITYGISRYRK
jgi:hypothetical protein